MQHDGRFNRTFMELKVLIREWSLLPMEFQSHLYGIESLRLFCKPSRLLVSIAPLWNWKKIYTALHAVHDGFNRTFMELKVHAVYHKVQGAHVSIAPLWNWKFPLFRLLNRTDGFNRTFMELKGNTNRVRAVSALFQSHLYGIESKF